MKNFIVFMLLFISILPFNLFSQNEGAIDGRTLQIKQEDNTLVVYDSEGNSFTGKVKNYIEINHKTVKIDLLTVENGYIQGFYITHWDNGNINELSSFKGGYRNGICKWYFEDKNNQIKKIGNYVNGIPTGIHKHFYDNGQLQLEVNFENKKLKEIRVYSEYGHDWVKYDGVNFYLFDDTSIEEIRAKISQGKVNGDIYLRGYNGNVMTVGFRFGRFQGNCTVYDDQGHQLQSRLVIGKLERDLLEIPKLVESIVNISPLQIEEVPNILNKSQHLNVEYLNVVPKKEPSKTFSNLNSANEKKTKVKKICRGCGGKGAFVCNYKFKNEGTFSYTIYQCVNGHYVKKSSNGLSTGKLVGDICSNCKGRGLITCRACGGKGYKQEI